MKSLIIGAILVLFCMAIGASIGSVYNNAVRFEANIGKYDQNSQNTLSAYTLKVKEAARVPKMYMADLKDIIKSTFEGRYGKDGSKAVFQFIQEKNLDVDSSMYKELQNIIKSGRDEFKLSQDRKLDVCAAYEVKLESLFSGFMLNIFGFPKKDIDRLCRIVIDTDTKEAFDTGVAKEINF